MPTVDAASKTNFSALQNKPKESENATLGKDDFMKLLLVELQNQDPTAPMDSDKILAQTSQLASLESTDNTNKSLAELAKSLSSANQFSTISAIGKIGDIGNDEKVIESSGQESSFELYFQDKIDSGRINITDSDGNNIRTIAFKQNPGNPEKLDILARDGSVTDTISPIAPNVYKFDWNGKTDSGSDVEKGSYHIQASATTPDNKLITTKLGAYPIESVRFDNGKASVKIGSSYVPFEELKEVY